MNYKRIYNNLIEKRRNFLIDKTIYQERHHCIPRCLGGSNDSDNLVSLTAREHYIAHLLLVKIYQNESDKLKYHKMLYAVECMSLFQDPSRYNLGYKRNFKMNSRLFELLKVKLLEAKSYDGKMRFKNMTKEQKRHFSQVISQSLKKYYETHKSCWIGKIHKKTTIDKMRKFAQNKPIKGKDNPSYNKIWICNDTTKKCMLWDKNEFIPDGWRKGRIFKTEESYNKLKHCKKESSLKKSSIKYSPPTKISDQQVKEWYEEYIKNGFEGVVEKFNYDKSCPNLVGIFKSRIPDFIPQQGRRRKMT